MGRTFLVLGCGSIGRRHLRNLRHLEAGDLLGFDPSAERRAEAAAESGAAPVASLEEALERGPDAILVCSPTSLHAEQAMRAASVADIFVEKPLASSHAAALQVAGAVEDRHRVCLVGCNLRFHPGVIALAQELARGGIGRPLSVRSEFGQYLPDWHPWEDYRRGYSARRDLGGGILLEAIHELDLVRWLAGPWGPVQGLAARVGDLEIDTEDIAVLCGFTGRGVLAEVHVDYLQRTPARSCTVVGTEGTLTWDVRAGQTVRRRPRGEAEVIADFAGLDPNAMYVEEMRHFLACLERREPPAQDARAAAELLRVVEEVTRVARPA